MKKIHAKSSCCHALIYRFGSRRRQCRKCKRTWRIRRKQQGRKQRRESLQSLRRVLIEGRILSGRNGQSRQNRSYHFRNALKQFLCSTSHPLPPPGPYILLTDGVWCSFQGKLWVLYLMAVRPINSTHAHFLPPVLQRGRENRNTWVEALKIIPASIHENIRALVCDNLPGMVYLGHKRGWKVQLCHVHLLRQLHRHRGRRHSQITGRQIREQLYQSIRRILNQPYSKSRSLDIQTVLFARTNPGLPRRLKMASKQFARYLSVYQTASLHPELKLPVTTNTVESKAREIRDLAGRARYFRTPKAFLIWVSAYLRLKPTIVCNPRYFQPN